MKFLRSSIVLPLLVVFVIAGGVTYAVVSAQKNERERLLNQFEEVTAPDNDAVFTDDAAMKESIETYGVAPTMQVMIHAAERAGVDCHNRAHQFGRMSYEMFGDEVLKLNLPECHSGFYHGAIEAYFKKNGTDHLKDKLSFICPPNLNVFFMHQCMHGLGHGLMAWSSYELPETLEYCNLIDADNSKASCRTGAFMENIIGSLQDSPEARAIGHVSKYISDDPQYPCNIVKDAYKADCYFLQTDRMYQLGHTFQSIVDGCNAAPKQYQYTCFASMGRSVSGNLRGRPQEALAACMLVADHNNRVQCITAIGQDQLWDPSGQQAALSFCGMVKPEDGQIECERAIIFHAQSVLNSDQLKNFCSQILPELQAECLKSPS